jgi:hypothetical protein
MYIIHAHTHSSSQLLPVWLIVAKEEIHRIDHVLSLSEWLGSAIGGPFSVTVNHKHMAISKNFGARMNSKWQVNGVSWKNSYITSTPLGQTRSLVKYLEPLSESHILRWNRINQGSHAILKSRYHIDPNRSTQDPHGRHKLHIESSSMF